MIAVIGAGAAGLAVAHELQRREIESTIFERGTVGHVWDRHYDRLHLHTLKEVSALPGLDMPADYPPFPSGPQVREYLANYQQHFALNIREGVEVRNAAWDGSTWRIDTTDGRIEARVLVATTGIWSTPWRPEIAGIDTFVGPVLHSSDYRNAASVTGHSVLVVGVGNSGSEIAVELANAGHDVAVSVRNGALFVPRPTSVRISKATAYLLRTLPPHIANLMLKSVRRDFADIGLPLPPTCPIDTYPVVGYELPEAVADGRIAVVNEIASVRSGHVEFVGGAGRYVDAIVFATGFRPTLGWLPSEAVELDADGIPDVDNASRSRRNPSLYCVGFRYPNTEGWLQSIGRVASCAATAIAKSSRYSLTGASAVGQLPHRYGGCGGHV